MKRTELKRKRPLLAKSSLKRSPMQRKRSARARSKDFSTKVRQVVMERSSGVCELCHMRKIEHLHHATYRSQGGTGELSNAIGLCIPCHRNAHAHRSIRELCVELAAELAAGQTVTA